MSELTAALDFLCSHLPEEDLRCDPPELLRQFAEHALFLREAAPWCRSLDWEIFCHYVLFPRVNNEDLSSHRKIFFDALWPRVRDLPSVEDVVLEVNCWCHEIATYQSTDTRTASPLTVYRTGIGRCGEESAFLVSALRSVGVPARQVYVPRWSHCDDNHAWVEALCGERWRFLGACEPEPVLDRGWFNASASRALLVHSRLFGEGSSPLHGQRLGTQGNVTFYDQTARYAPVPERVFRAVSGGRPAAGTVFRLQVLNEASFHTVAALAGDENGEVRVELGPGTVHVLATLDGLRAEGDSEGGALTLNLSPAGSTDVGWTDFESHAAQPAPVNLSPLDAAQRAQRAEVRREGTARRQARQTALRRSDPAHPQWNDLLDEARGNGGEILAFLRGDNAPDRERLLRTLAPKDLRDTDRETLEDHFTRLPPRRGDVPEDVYWKYLACPRIGLEKIVPWRGGQYGAMGERERLIAGLRVSGTPARLRPLDGSPEVWDGSGFRPVSPESTGTLLLRCPEAPVYLQNWSLSRQSGEGWDLLDLSSYNWRDGCLTAVLPAGAYRLITAVRLPGGDQLASRMDVFLEAGEEKTVSLRLRAYDLEDALFSQPMPAVPAATPDGVVIPNIFCSDGRPSLLLWLEEGAEPTEHLLLELEARREAFAALPLNVVFLLRSREAVEQPTLARVLARWPEARVLLDDWAFDLEETARRLARDPDAPPLAVLCDGQSRAVYAESGYRVGAADLLLRAAVCLCGK